MYAPLQIMATILEESDRVSQQLLDTFLSYLLPPLTDDNPEGFGCVILLQVLVLLWHPLDVSNALHAPALLGLHIPSRPVPLLS